MGGGEGEAERARRRAVRAAEAADIARALVAKEAQLARWKALKASADAARAQAAARGACGGGAVAQPQQPQQAQTAAPAANDGCAGSGGVSLLQGPAAAPGAVRETPPQGVQGAARGGAGKDGVVPETELKDAAPRGSGREGGVEQGSKVHELASPARRGQGGLFGLLEEEGEGRAGADAVGVNGAEARASTGAEAGPPPAVHAPLAPFGELQLGAEVLSAVAMGPEYQPTVAVLARSACGACSLVVWMAKDEQVLITRVAPPEKEALRAGAGYAQLLTGCDMGAAVVAGCITPWGAEDSAQRCLHLFKVHGKPAGRFYIKHYTALDFEAPGGPRCVVELPGVGLFAGGEAGTATLWPRAEKADDKTGLVGFQAKGCAMPAARYLCNELPEIVTLAVLPGRVGWVAGCASSGSVITWNAREGQVISVAHSPFHGVVEVAPMSPAVTRTTGLPAALWAEPPAFVAVTLVRKRMSLPFACYGWFGGDVWVPGKQEISPEGARMALIPSADDSAEVALGASGAIVLVDLRTGDQTGHFQRELEEGQSELPKLSSLQWHAASRTLFAAWEDGACLALARPQNS